MKTDELKLNLGCGMIHSKGYVNIDIDQVAAPDLLLDVEEGLPYEDNTVDEVRAIDFLEHIHQDKVVFVMQEIHRVLKPQGVLHYYTPSTDGRGAFQDPDHRSYWNMNTWMYFTDPVVEKLRPHYPLFEIIAMRNFTSDEEQKVIHTEGKLKPVKKVTFQDFPRKAPAGKLEILLATNQLLAPGGTENYTYELAKEFYRRGHSIDVFTVLPGKYTEQFKPYARVSIELRDEYDLLLVNHSPCLLLLRGCRGPKVFTSHGADHFLEQPISGADIYVAVTGEVQKNIKRHGLDSTIIWNGIDLERFVPIIAPSYELRKVLHFWHDDDMAQVVEHACNDLGVEYIEIGKNERTDDMEKTINSVDLVVTTGRAAYEAMACGRPLLWYIKLHLAKPDISGGPNQNITVSRAFGMVTEKNILQVMENDYGPDGFNIEWGVEEMKEEMLKYDDQDGIFLRQYAEKHLDIKEKADHYLGLLEGAQL